MSTRRRAWRRTAAPDVGSAPWCRWRRLGRRPRDPYLSSCAGHRLLLRASLATLGVVMCAGLLWAGLSLGGLALGPAAAMALFFGWATTCALSFGVARWLVASEVTLGPGGSLALTPFPKRHVARDRSSLAAKAAMFGAVALPLYLIAYGAGDEEPTIVGRTFYGLQLAWMPVRGWGYGTGDGFVLPVALFGLIIDLSWYPLAAAWGAAVGVRAARPVAERWNAFWVGAACFGGVLAGELLMVRLLAWLANDGSWYGWRRTFWHSDIGLLLVLMLGAATLAGPFWARLALAGMLRERAARELDRAELVE